MANSFLGVGAPVIVGKQIQKFNKLVANETPMTFMTEILGQKIPLNVSSDNMIELHLDGRFLDVSEQAIPVEQNTVW